MIQQLKCCHTCGRSTNVFPMYLFVLKLTEYRVQDQPLGGMFGMRRFHTQTSPGGDGVMVEEEEVWGRGRFKEENHTLTPVK